MMKLFVVEFGDKVDLEKLQKISKHLLNNPRRLFYDAEIKVPDVDKVFPYLETETYCRETLTSNIRRALRYDGKSKVLLVYASGEVRGVTNSILKKHFTDFAVEFLSHSNIPEEVVRAGTCVHKKAQTIIFPITAADIVTAYTSASALILIFRNGQNILDETGKDIISYHSILKNFVSDIKPKAKENPNSWWYAPQRTRTITGSTLLWYILHFFDLHNVNKMGYSYYGGCNGPQSFYGGYHDRVNKRLSSLKDETRILMIKDLLGKKKKVFLSNFSENLRNSFDAMLSNVEEPSKIKQIKGASL